MPITTLNQISAQLPKQQQYQQTSNLKRKSRSKSMDSLKLVTIVCSICLIGCLMPARQVECGRLQDFIQNLVGGGSSNSNSNSNSNNNGNSNSNSNSNSNNNDSNDSDAAATGDTGDQQMTPMMSAMNPFMRYPSFYDNFGPASYGGYPGMSFQSPMGAMSGLSPMAAMSSSSLNGAFSPASFAPTSFGSYGSSSGNPMSAFAGANGMSASTLSNVYASASPSILGSYTPYYGKKK